MSYLEILYVALQALRRNKMRSGLTMLGIIIGVAAVVTMVAIGQGASKSVEESIGSLGDNIMMVQPGSYNKAGVRTGWGGWTSLTSDDATAITAQCPSVGYVSPVVSPRGASNQIVFEGANWSTTVQGVGPSYLEARKYELTDGRNFTDAEVRGQAKVVVLGQVVVDNLFNGNNPVGSTIRLKGLPFEVIGLLKSKGANAMGMDQDDVAMIPFTTALRKLTGQTNVNMIIATGASKDLIKQAKTEITDLLRLRHRIGPEADDDFIIRTQEDVVSTATQATNVMTLLLGSIAAVSLVVGGIGIMNIMLVSVTERTREIGIRMAIGATERDVLVQFLMEAVVLSSLGGIIGLLLAFGAASLISAIAGWPTSVSVPVMVLSFVFSALVGIFFGYYPARSAARMDPIEALRYE